MSDHKPHGVAAEQNVDVADERANLFGERVEELGPGLGPGGVADVADADCVGGSGRRISGYASVEFDYLRPQRCAEPKYDRPRRLDETASGPPRGSGCKELNAGTVVSPKQIDRRVREVGSAADEYLPPGPDRS